MRNRLTFIVREIKSGFAIFVDVPGQALPDDTGQVFGTRQQAEAWTLSVDGKALLSRFEEKHRGKL